MKDSRLDAQEYCPVVLGYDARPTPPDDLPRLGKFSYDLFLTTQGSLSKRPGDQSTVGKGAVETVKMWEYNTLPANNGTVYKYLVTSNYYSVTGKYVLIIYPSSFGSSYIPTLRDCDVSERVHECIEYNGKLYVKSFPNSASSEKLGTIIVDGSGGTLSATPWGLLPPTTPARITGDVTKLNGTLTATATTVTVDSTTGFDTPAGRIQIGTELIDYTGTTATTFTGCTRGAQGTDKAAHDDNTIVLQRDWAASDHKVEVNDGWYYSYAYKSITGQVSSRAPIEKNEDLLPSYTGPFFDLKPKVTVQGHSDTTNIPKIVMYRTKDGGGTFLKLEEITNTGSGSITYIDDSHGTGASSTTFNDPLPDDILDGEDREYAPSTVSNDPPPTVEPPQVTGTDTVSLLCYSMATYAGRIWFAVGRHLYFSSREELVAGNNEESFKSGEGGNFIPFNELIVGLQATSLGLYVLTTGRFIRITGTTKDTFTDVQLAATGGPIPDNIKSGRTITAVKEKIAFLGFDSTVYLVDDDKVQTISDPVIPFYAQQGQYLDDIQYYKTYDYELIIVSYNQKDIALSDSYTYWYIYDLKKSQQLNRDIWWPPWRMNSNCHVCTSGFTGKRAIPTIYRSLRNTVTGTSRLVQFGKFSPGFLLGLTDYTALSYQQYYETSDVGNPTQSYACIGYILSLRPPTGNNLNLVNRPQRNVELEGVYIHVHPGNLGDAAYGVESADPTVRIALDNNAYASYSQGKPPRIQYTNTNNINERILYYPVNQNCYRANMEISLSAQNKGMEIQRFSTWWDISRGGIK